MVKAQKPKGVLAIWPEVKTSGLPSVRILSPGSSLTIFFVDLHQGLVGLLCSCQTVLRLRRGSHQIRPWPAVALLPPPSIGCHPETQESQLLHLCSVNILNTHHPEVPLECNPPAFPFQSCVFPQVLRSPSGQGPAPVPTVGVPGPLIRLHPSTGLYPLGPSEKAALAC